jgi:hypothetical protein
MAAKPKKAEPRRCDTCAYYVKATETEGVCRRFPPQLSAPNYSQWPAVRGELWCGEFSRV